MWPRRAAQTRASGDSVVMKKSIRKLGLVTLAGAVLAGCASRETQIHTTTTGARAESSGVTDASDVSGGAASAAAAGAAIGNPGR